MSIRKVLGRLYPIIAAFGGLALLTVIVTHPSPIANKSSLPKASTVTIIESIQLEIFTTEKP